VIAEPLFDRAVKEIVAEPSPAVAPNPVGASGTLLVVNVLEVPGDALSPAALIALT